MPNTTRLSSEFIYGLVSNVKCKTRLVRTYFLQNGIIYHKRKSLCRYAKPGVGKVESTKIKTYSCKILL